MYDSKHDQRMIREEHMDRENGNKGRMEAEAGVMQPKAKECLEPPEAQQDNEGSFPGAFGESMALLTP